MNDVKLILDIIKYHENKKILDFVVKECWIVY